MLNVGMNYITFTWSSLNLQNCKNTTQELLVPLQHHLVNNPKRNSQEVKTMTVTEIQKKSEKEPYECRIYLEKVVKNQLL